MPRIFTLDEDQAFDDEDLEDPENDPYRVSPEAYHYIPPPAFGGPGGPVHVTVASGAPPPARKPPSLLDRLLGRPQPPVPGEWETKLNAASAALASQMAALGAVTAYIRYDGGNDEGFAWFDHCKFADGSMRDAARMAEDLKAAGAPAALKALWDGPVSMKDALDDVVATNWAVQLLGQGYGTGEYMMYGAFSVDLHTGLVTDDSDPAPVVQNIEFGE